MPPRRLPAVLFAVFLCGCLSRTEPEPVWVGCVTSLSGPDQSSGVQLARGVELAVDDAVAGGKSVEGRPPAVIRVDDHGDATAVQAEAVRLLTVNRVSALLGGPDPDRGEKLARAAQSYGTPVLLASEAAGDLPGEAAFTLGVAPSRRGAALARYARRDLKGGRAAVLRDGRDAVAAAAAQGFVREWERGDKAEAREWVYRSDGEQEEQVKALKGYDPAVVLIAAPPADFLKLRGRLATDSMTAPILYAGPDACAESFVHMGDGGEVYLATVYAADALTERGRDWAARYRERFHEAPSLAAAQGYDAARLLFESMAQTNSAAPERLRDQLAGTKGYESVTGPLSFQDRRAVRPLFIVRLKGGEAKRVQTVAPEDGDAAR